MPKTPPHESRLPDKKKVTSKLKTPTTKTSLQGVRTPEQETRIPISKKQASSATKPVASSSTKSNKKKTISTPSQSNKSKKTESQPSSSLASEEPSPLNPLEIPEIATKIAEYVTDKTGDTEQINRRALTRTSQFFYQIVQPSSLIFNLLLATSHGNERKVKNFFEKSPANIFYLTGKNNIEDYSGRKFQRISAFQYALWALDWRMWTMMLKAVDNAEANAITQDELDSMPAHKRRGNLITKEEIATLRATLLEQYQEVVNKGLNYTIEQKQVKGETHFDLKGPEFCLMPPEQSFKPEKGKIYTAIKNGSLYYTMINLVGEQITDSIPLNQLSFSLEDLETIDSLKPFIPQILKTTSERGHTHPQALISALLFYEGFDDDEFRIRQEEMDKHWCHNIGTAQRLLPANIAQEYVCFANNDDDSEGNDQLFDVHNPTLNRRIISNDYQSETCWFPLSKNYSTIGILGSDIAYVAYHDSFLSERTASKNNIITMTNIMQPLSKTRIEDRSMLLETLLTSLKNQEENKGPKI
ncbi:hypothetical protein [Legionella fairfieldensis]|uniref:hypothetical protein n=1 Tax=Legionella fairfieldensis TaxID=45064 RepID=UPI00049045FE|nr:hypothetical protein [Legionella fairfieldensis]